MRTIKDTLEDEKVRKNVELLEKIVRFCEDNKLTVKDNLKTRYVLTLRVKIGDKLWSSLKSMIIGDPSYCQKRSERPNLYDGEIMVKNDKPSDAIPRISILYNWEGGHDKLAKKNSRLFSSEPDGTIEIRIDLSDSFFKNNFYGDRIEYAIKSICPDINL